MSLTDDWKAGKLPFGDYWCHVTGSPYIEEVSSDCMTEEDIVEILAPVPSYKEAQRLRKIDNTTKIFRRKIESQRKEIASLRELLKECLVYIPYSYPQFQTEKRIDLDSAKLNLITRINAAIGESEE